MVVLLSCRCECRAEETKKQGRFVSIVYLGGALGDMHHMGENKKNLGDEFRGVVVSAPYLREN